MKEFAVALGKAMGRPAFMPAPGFALQMLFGEMASILLNGQRVIPNRLLQQGFKFKYSTVDAALSAIYRA
jgi:NAD dependent epimerase/dehydratase family enzyme